VDTDRGLLADNLPALARMAKKKTLPYWLDGGTETCEFCTHPHVLQSEYRCAACDRAACEHCVTVDRETGEVLCHECHAEEEGDG
jgi:hypothetical protein